MPTINIDLTFGRPCSWHGLQFILSPQSKFNGGPNTRGDYSYFFTERWYVYAALDRPHLPYIHLSFGLNLPT